MPRLIEVNRGHLRFQSIRKEDEGEYRCAAINSVGSDDQIIKVYVRTSAPDPTPEIQHPEVEQNDIVIVPTHYEGAPNQDVHLTCSGTSGNLNWAKYGYNTLPTNIYVRDGILIIQQPQIVDSGRYICSSYHQIKGPQQQSVDVIIREGPTYGTEPKINPLKSEHLVTQGTDYTITCEVFGSPYPTVKWTKLHESFDSNVQQTGNILRILNAQVSNRGVYICVAHNDKGEDQQSCIVEIDRKFN